MQTPLHRSCNSAPARPRLATTPRPTTLPNQRPDRSRPRNPLRRVVGPVATRYVVCTAGEPQSVPDARLGQLPCGENVQPTPRPRFGFRPRRRAQGRPRRPPGSTRDRERFRLAASPQRIANMSSAVETLTTPTCNVGSFDAAEAETPETVPQRGLQTVRVVRPAYRTARRRSAGNPPDGRPPPRPNIALPQESPHVAVRKDRAPNKPPPARSVKW